MKNTKKSICYILLTDAGWRNAGEADIAGKHVTWDSAFLFYGIELGEPRPKMLKLKIAEQLIESAESTTEELPWGSVVKVELDGQFITNFIVVSDNALDYTEELLQ